MKKLLAIVLSLMLCLSACSFAAAEETDPAKILTQGVWNYAFAVEGMNDFVYYFHFYEDVPGYGGVFYAGFALNQLNFAGTWTVKKAEKAYSVYEFRGAEAPVEGTAPYTVTFCDWNGNVLDQCAFDGEILYNDMMNVYGMYSAPNMYRHVTDVESDKYADVYVEEKDIAIMDFVAEDPTCTMTLYHNGRYMDLVSMMVEGTWAMSQHEDGSRVYTLTPDDELDTPAVFTVSADSKTAHYVNEDGEEMDMVNTAAGAEAALILKGSYAFMEGLNADLTLSCMEDGTCELLVDVFGNVAALDQGTWSMGEDGFTINFVFEVTGEKSTVLNMETFAVELQYQQAGTAIGDVDCTLAVVVE